MVEQSLKQVLTDSMKYLEDGGVLDAFVVKRLNAEYGVATNAGKCPCGADEVFFKCCKSDWKIFQSTLNKEKTEEKEQKKNIPDANSDTKWVCKIGIAANGVPNVVPIKGGIEMGIEGISNLLLTTYNMINNEAVVQRTLAIIMQQQQQPVSGRKNPLFRQ